MIFFFKKKPLVVELFTYRQDLLDYSKIDYAHKFLPDWWKSMPKTYQDEREIAPSSTIKACDGFIENYKKGFMIPMWSDLLWKNDEYGNVSWAFADRKSSATSHPHEQWKNFAPESKYFHLKIETPWFISCKEDVNFSWTQPMWNFNDYEMSDFFIPPAIIDFKYQMGCNINAFIRYEKNKEIIFHHGQPMAHLVPLTERKLVLKHELVSHEKYQVLGQKQALITFTGKYRKIKRIMKAKESGCPFGFGK